MGAMKPTKNKLKQVGKQVGRLMEDRAAEFEAAVQEARKDLEMYEAVGVSSLKKLLDGKDAAAVFTLEGMALIPKLYSSYVEQVDKKVDLLAAEVQELKSMVQQMMVMLGGQVLPTVQVAPTIDVVEPALTEDVPEAEEAVDEPANDIEVPRRKGRNGLAIDWKKCDELGITKKVIFHYMNKALTYGDIRKTSTLKKHLKDGSGVYQRILHVFGSYEAALEEFISQ